MRNEKGFTLIEMLGVIILIGIIVMIIIPVVQNQTENARARAYQATVNEIGTAIDRYEFDNGQIPTYVSELVEANYLREYPRDPWNLTEVGKCEINKDWDTTVKHEWMIGRYSVDNTGKRVMSAMHSTGGEITTGVYGDIMGYEVFIYNEACNEVKRVRGKKVILKDIAGTLYDLEHELNY